MKVEDVTEGKNDKEKNGMRKQGRKLMENKTECEKKEKTRQGARK